MNVIVIEPVREKTNTFSSDTNQPVQSQKQARSLKFRIEEEEEGLYYPCSENKGTDQLRNLLAQFPMQWLSLYLYICVLEQYTLTPLSTG